MHAGAHPNHTSDLPLLLLPGTLCDARVFAPLQQRLPSLNTRVHLTPGAHTLEEAADQVLAEAPSRFALLGFSLGGMVAMETTLRAPNRVHGLALLSTTPIPVPPERHSARRAAVNHARTLPMSHFLREHLWPEYSSRKDGRSGNPLTLALLERMAETLGPAAFANQTEQALRRSDFQPRLAALTCPTLILSGDQDTLCPPNAQHHLAQAIPHATTVLLSNAGHFALLEQPDEIASAVAAWFHIIAAQSTTPKPTRHASQEHIRENE